MGFSTPSWVTMLPPAPTENAIDAGNKGALAGYQLGQLRAVRGALQNTDINDPASTNTAIGALVKAGATDQASALMNLNFTRDLRSRVPGVFDRIARSGDASAQPAAPTPDTMTADQAQHAADSMSQGADTLRQIRALPADQRQAAFDAAKPGFVQRGVPEAAIDAIGADIGDDAKLDEHIAYLSAHADHFAGQAQPNAGPMQAPTMAHPNQFAWATNIESDPQLQLGIALAKAAGLDLSGLTDTAKALVMPQIEAQAKAQFAQQQAQGTTAGTNLANTNPATAPAPFAGAVRGPDGSFVMAPGAQQGQTAAAGATALGTEAGGHGGEVLYRADGTPVVQPVQGAAGTAAGFEGAQAGARAGAEAAATSPSHIINLPTPDGGQISGSMVKGPNGWTFQPVQEGAGAAGTGAGRAVTPQQAAVNKASADALVADRASAGQLQANLVPLRTVYDLVRRGDVNLGPGSEAVNNINKFFTTYFGTDQKKVAAFDQAQKYLVQIANQRAGQFGQGTNEKLAIAAHGSPNVNMSNLGALEVLRMNIALARADAAKAASYTGPPEGYSAYASNYGRTVDPRAFMLDLLSPAERATMLRGITSAADKRAFLAGKQAAINAGVYTDADIPR